MRPARFHVSPIVLALLTLAATSAGATDLFTMTFTDGTQTASRGYNSSGAVFTGTSTAYIQQSLPGYVTTDALTIQIDYLGMPTTVSFAAGSRAVTLYIPAAGIQQTFTGLNRDDSVVQMQNYFKANGGVALGRILSVLARTNPVDPAAGMVGSQVAVAFDGQFGGFGFVDGPANDGATDPTTSRTGSSGSDGSATTSSDGGSTPPSPGSNGLVGVGLTIGGTTYGNVRQYVSSLPLSYTVRNPLEPRRQLTLMLNVAEYRVNGAATTSISPGVAYSWPVSTDWTVTPSLQYGYTSSSDMGTAAQVATVAVSSSYRLWSDDAHVVVMGNMIGRAESIGLKQAGVTVDPGIGVTALSNGFMYSQPLDLMGKRLALEASAVNTTFVGTALYTQHLNQVALTLGTNRAARTSRDYLRAGLKYEFSSTTHGLSAQVGYWF